MPSSLPLFIVCALHGLYAAVVTIRWLLGEPIPPAQINSIVVASAVVCAVIVLDRRHARHAAKDLNDLRRQVDKLHEAQTLSMDLAVYMQDAATLFELGRRAERARRRGDGPTDSPTTPP